MLTPVNLKYTNNYLIFHLSTQSGEYLFFLKLIYISWLAVGNNYKKSAIGCRIWIPYIYMYQVFESNLLFLFFENVNGKATCFPEVVSILVIWCVKGTNFDIEHQQLGVFIQLN